MGVLFFLQITLAILVAYLPFAGWMSVPLTGDQKVYLSTALEMQSQGSYGIPYLFGEPSYYKPPLQYWATIAGMKSMGFSLFGAFIPSVFTAWVAALALWWVGKRVFSSSQVGARAALWFLASIGTATFALSAQMEIYLVAFAVVAWAFALSYLERTPADRLKNPWALYAAFAVAGALSLVKSPLYSVFWVVGYFFFLALRAEWREFRSLHLYSAWAMGMMVGSSWFLAVLALDHDRFLSDYVIRETISKNGGNGSSPGGLWATLLSFALPFVLLAIAGLLTMFRRTESKVRDFVLASCLPAALFFSFYPYRVTTYLYVLIPTLALLAAGFENQGGKWARLALRVTAAAMSGVLAYLVWLSVRIELLSGVVATLSAVAGVVICAAWVGAIFRPGRAVWAALGLVAWVHALGVGLGERDLKDLREFVKTNRHRQLSMLDLHQNIWHEVGLISLALATPIERVSNAEEVLDSLDAGHAVIVSPEEVEAMIESVHELLAEDDDGREVQVAHWKRLETRRNLPLQELLRARAKLELSRDFKILTLPQRQDWILPEGGV